MFIVRLKTYLERWVKPAKALQTYGTLKDLFIKEQFLVSNSADLSAYCREREPADLDEVARLAELFLTARRRQMCDRGKARYYKFTTSLSVSRRENPYAALVGSLDILRIIAEIKGLISQANVKGVINAES